MNKIVLVFLLLSFQSFASWDHERITVEGTVLEIEKQGLWISSGTSGKSRLFITIDLIKKFPSVRADQKIEVKMNHAQFLAFFKRNTNELGVSGEGGGGK